MDFGITLFTSDRGPRPERLAAHAEGLGFRSFYVPEHTHIPVDREAMHPTGGKELPDDRYRRTLDPWATLGAVSAVTTDIRLGTAVALPVESDPIGLAKTIATVDHLSGGRVTLGVGFGWNLDELRDHGVPLGRRRTMLRQYLEAMRQLWTEDEAEFHGEFVDFPPSWAWPKPVQTGGPKVVVGAAGTEKNFEWICRAADGWMTTPIETDAVAGIGELRRMWDAAGRSGRPYTVILDGKPDPANHEKWRLAEADEVVYGTPDAAEDDVRSYLDRLAAKLGLT